MTPSPHLPKILAISALLTAILLAVFASITLNPIRRYQPLLGEPPDRILSVVGPPLFDTRSDSQTQPTSFMFGYRFPYFGDFEFHFENNKLAHIKTGPNK